MFVKSSVCVKHLEGVRETLEEGQSWGPQVSKSQVPNKRDPRVGLNASLASSVSLLSFNAHLLSPVLCSNQVDQPTCVLHLYFFRSPIGICDPRTPCYFSSPYMLIFTSLSRLPFCPRFFLSSLMCPTKLQVNHQSYP